MEIRYVRLLYGFRAKVSHVLFQEFNDIDMSLLVPETDKCRRSLTGIFMSRALNNILSTGAISLREALYRDGTELNGNEEILSRYFHRKDPGRE